jgi:hypothetical protein
MKIKHEFSHCDERSSLVWLVASACENLLSQLEEDPNAQMVLDHFVQLIANRVKDLNAHTKGGKE